MASFCPLCDKNLTNDFFWLQHECSRFSIEMELLDLPFSLEPYGQPEECFVSALKTDIKKIPEYSVRSERKSSGFLGISTQKRPSPLFLRL